MKVSELRGKTEQELEGELSKLRKEVSELRIEHRTESLADPSVLRKKRREIARLMTVLGEKEILAEVKTQSSAVKSTRLAEGEAEADSPKSKVSEG